VKLVVNRVPEPLPAPASPGDDPFAAFTSEAAPPPPAAETAAPANVKVPWEWPKVTLPRIGPLTRRILVVTLSVAVLAGAGFTGFQRVRSRWLTAAATGVLTVASNPSGAEVLIDGNRLGVTPVTANVPVGSHKVTIRSGGVSKDLSITSKKNIELVQNVEFGPAVASTGTLSVSSDPEGLKIAIDGATRGVTPAMIDRLTPGNHVVTLTGKGAPMERTVLITAGGTASLMVSKPVEPTGGTTGAVGSVQVISPIDVELFEGESLIGNSRSARLFLPAGSHTLTAVNDTLGFSRSMTIDVKPGAPGKLTVPIPNGALSVNAQPWAEVIVDGKSLGETPIGNYALPIGSHELVLKHPQFGERKQTVVVGVGRTARIGVDFRK
jgi:hypothetical protein